MSNLCFELTVIFESTLFMFSIRMNECQLATHVMLKIFIYTSTSHRFLVLCHEFVWIYFRISAEYFHCSLSRHRFLKHSIVDFWTLFNIQFFQKWKLIDYSTNTLNGKTLFLEIYVLPM